MTSPVNHYVHQYRFFLKNWRLKLLRAPFASLPLAWSNTRPSQKKHNDGKRVTLKYIQLLDVFREASEMTWKYGYISLDAIGYQTSPTEVLSTRKGRHRCLPRNFLQCPLLVQTEKRLATLAKKHMHRYEIGKIYKIHTHISCRN